MYESSPSLLSNKSMNMSHFRQNPLAMGQIPDWACGWGQDRYGTYADFSVSTGPKYYDVVNQRMRWIPPGEFMMGSKPEESKRDDDETHHQDSTDPRVLAGGYVLYARTLGCRDGRGCQQKQIPIPAPNEPG